MKQTVYSSDFLAAFERAGRGKQFSYEGLGVLFDYLEDCEKELGEEYELDVIALCCDFAEGTWQEIAEDYSIDLTGADDDENQAIVEEYLIGEGAFVGEVEGGFVYRQH